MQRWEYQCTGEGTVITIEANPLPVSLCPHGAWSL